MYAFITSLGFPSLVFTFFNHHLSPPPFHLLPLLSPCCCPVTHLWTAACWSSDRNCCFIWVWCSANTMLFNCILGLVLCSETYFLFLFGIYLAVFWDTSCSNFSERACVGVLVRWEGCLKMSFSPSHLGTECRFTSFPSRVLKVAFHCFVVARGTDQRCGANVKTCL